MERWITSVVDQDVKIRDAELGRDFTIGHFASPPTPKAWEEMVQEMRSTRPTQHPDDILGACREAVILLGGEPNAIRLQSLGEGWPLPPMNGPELEGGMFVGPTATAWMEWLVGCVAGGRQNFEINGALRLLDVSGANEAVTAFTTSPGFKLVVDAHRAVDAYKNVVKVRRLFERNLTIPRIPIDEMTEERFFSEFWTGQRPCVVEGLTRDWEGWTFESLAAAHGETSIEVTVRRDGMWWRDRQARHQEMKLADLIRYVHEENGDGLYCVGHNHLIKRIPAFLDRIRAPFGCTKSQKDATAWIGPAGTRTPLHFDITPVWLAQLVGSKRVFLASPLETNLFETAVDGYYNHGALSDRSTLAPDVRHHELEIHEGDAVFIPPTWWHEVHSLTRSMSVSMQNFRFAEDVRWYQVPASRTEESLTSS